MLADELFDRGLTRAEADALSEKIENENQTDTQFDFVTLNEKFLRPEYPFSVHEFLYHRFAIDDIVWRPSANDIDGSNLNYFFRKLGVNTVEDVHKFSVNEPELFWQYIVEYLGICFKGSIKPIIDDKSEPESVVFFPKAELNIAQSCFRANSNEIAIIYQYEGGLVEEVSYGSLEKMTRQVAAGITALGVKPGSRIAMDMPMTAESVAIYLGIIWAGCVVVGIADSFSADEIRSRLDLVGPIIIFTQEVVRRAGKVIPLYERIQRADGPQAVVLPEPGLMLRGPLRNGDMSWDEFIVKDSIDPTVCRSTDHTNILFSSGTTGMPKAIPWDHITPIKCAMDACFHHDIGPREIVAWPTNLGWMMGPWLIYGSLINRATIALYYGAPTSRDFIDFVQKSKVNVLGTIPSIVRTWREKNVFQATEFKHLRVLSSTGECSNASDMLWLMASVGYKPVLEYCGGTELAGGYLGATMLQPARPACFTTPTFGTNLVIKDEENRESNIGEVFLESCSLGMSRELLGSDHTATYFRGTPVKGKRLLRRHGDAVEKVGPDCFRVHGRIDDAMNLGGIKVGSAEIERVLNTIDGLRETAAVAVPPRAGGPSQLILYVVLEKPINGLIELLQTTIKEKINPLFKISDVIELQSLPRTDSNKVIRRALRELYVSSREKLKSSNPKQVK